MKEWAKSGKSGPEPKPYQGRMGSDDVDGTDTAYRVIADHIRTLTFGITDRIQPSNGGTWVRIETDLEAWGAIWKAISKAS